MTRGALLPFLTATVLIVAGCNRTSEPMSLRVEGEVRTVPSGEAVEGAQWSLFERAVLDGALQAEEEVASAMTDATCLLYTSPSPRDKRQSRMPSSA